MRPDTALTRRSILAAASALAASAAIIPAQPASAGAALPAATDDASTGKPCAGFVDVVHNTPETVGVDDLKTVVRHLLSHNGDGTVKRDAVDFDVAISHNHGDHTGKVPQMTDRTVYYPDLDWRPTATPNWVPVRQDGGPTQNDTLDHMPCHTARSAALRICREEL